MSETVTVLKQPDSKVIDAEAILNNLPNIILVINEEDCIRQVNTSAEQFFKASASYLIGRKLSKFLPEDSPLFALIRQVRSERKVISEYNVTLDTPRIGRHFVNIRANLINEMPDCIVISLQERSIADTIDRQLNHKGAARSVSAMAAMLAHEVKNPLSGIRGAAQLLEMGVDAQDRPLTELIRDETDRICAIVDRMDVFSDSGPLNRVPVNIHQVLNRVRQLAENGFGQHVKFTEIYDPSLPSVLGNRDQLVQVFLNLVKNACESCPKKSGEIILSTAYRHGVRFAVPGSESQVHLPLSIGVQDNGDGIPEDIKPHLFDPFVTSKPKGSGLGLPLVAKIIDDHGGVIEHDSQPGRTVFRIMLPMTEDAPDNEDR